MTISSRTSASVAKARQFDVREFTRTARGNHRDSLDLAEFSINPLGSEALRVLRYLRDLEGATMQHLRNLLVTATHKDARVTAFLVTWAFEKFWIADAIDAVLNANGDVSQSGNARKSDAAGMSDLAGKPDTTGKPDTAGKRRHTLAEVGERRGPITRALAAIRQGTDIIAVHTTTGLIDEWITRAAYERVSEIANSPALRVFIETVLEIKQRHQAYFAEESMIRLTESPRAARMTSRAVSRAAWPIGAIDRSAEDRTFFEVFTFGNPEGAVRARAIRQAIASLPGIGDRVAASAIERLVP